MLGSLCSGEPSHMGALVSADQSVVSTSPSAPGNPVNNGEEGVKAETIATHQLSHLKQLEAESIHIIREVAAEFANPVMLYSIGKDSSVMVRLAQKASHPGHLPFPLMHIDTTWKFRDMIRFRDEFTKANHLELIVHTNTEGVKQGIN